MELFVGESLVRLSSITATAASRVLVHAQWFYREPEWFDHRRHLLDPEKWFTDYWAASADNAIRVLPLDGTMLDLCSGDGFYDFYFYRKRARRIVCIESDAEAHAHARRFHAADNIDYRLQNLLSFEPEPSSYDVVLIRGAIEHFTQLEQQQIFQMAHRALKPGGWFCGDTPEKSRVPGEIYLSHHKFEWADEAEMRNELGHVFPHAETEVLASNDPSISGYKTLFWRCQKKASEYDG